ncbi:hypothetical protein [Streptomyces sp. NPDC001260]|uniref:hypothetical protein n=1 Tax=Streptomyces sp. NPDC001260 TaxID=3364551 RepID=UPI003695318D
MIDISPVCWELRTMRRVRAELVFSRCRVVKPFMQDQAGLRSDGCVCAVGCAFAAVTIAHSHRDACRRGMVTMLMRMSCASRGRWPT